MNEKPSVEDYLHYIGADVPARGSGWRKMKCCFHLDSHASAAVNFDKNAFVCHGCGVKGDTYSLIMQREGMNFSEAKQFAEKFSTTGNTEIRSGDRKRIGVSVKPSSLGRRGKHLSSGGGRRPTART